MDKSIRKAVRCYLIKDNKVVVKKYKKGNRKEGYYDIPGGKIEDGEIPKQTAIREMKEETGIDIKNLKYKGIMTIEYPDRKFVFDTFISDEYEGEPQKFEENTSTIDNYTVRKALDFTTQTLEFLYFVDKYKDKTQSLIRRIEQEQYLLKISKLIDWVENDNPYTYNEFLKQ